MKAIRFTPLILVVTLLALAIGCSAGDQGAVTPAADRGGVDRTPGMHQFWGMWQFRANPAAQTLEIVPIRYAEFHLNTLVFLEPPPLVNLTLESLKFIGNTIEADIGLRHPFLGLTEFTGFDVCGIMITNGSVTGFNDPDLRLAGIGDTRLLNPDGYTRWWNPAEFPINDKSMFCYKDGLLGAPDSYANYNCTLNPYKYFCDDLDATESLDGITPANRGFFSAGQKNIRRYIIELGSEGLIFNYAVDASWQFPSGPHPWKVPDDFSPDANRVEAYRISVTEVSNTLWNDGSANGGDLSLSINVYDWFNASANTVYIESPGSFPLMVITSPSGGTAVYSTYTLDIIGATPKPNSINLLIAVESEAVGYQDLLPGKPVSAYFTRSVKVSNEAPPLGKLVALADANAYEVAPNTTVYFNGAHSYDENGFAIVDYAWDFGDMSPVTHGINVNHLYTTAGLYSIKLTVENVKGTKDDDIIGILVCDCSGKSGRHLSATYYNGDLDAAEENFDKRATDHMYTKDYWVMQNGDDIVAFNMTGATGLTPPQLNPVATLSTGVTGIVYSLDCGLDDRVAWASNSDKTVMHIVSATGVKIKDIKAPTAEEFCAADFDVSNDLWVVTKNASGVFRAHQYVKGDDNSYNLDTIWSHNLPNISAAKNVYDIQVLHSTESLYVVSDCEPAQNPSTPTWPRARIDVYDRFGDFIRSRAPYYWSVYPDPWPHSDIELDSTVPALEACRLNWYQTYQQPALYFCNSYRRLTLLLADISINFDQCGTRSQAMDLSNITKRLESIDLDTDQYRYWTDIPSDW